VYVKLDIAPSMLIKVGDETRPVCKACGKKNRPCQWEEPHTKFKDYRPEGTASSSKSAVGGTDEEYDDQEDMMEIDDSPVDSREEAILAGGGSVTCHRDTSPTGRKNSRTDTSEGQSTSVSSPTAQWSPGSPYSIPRARPTTGGFSVASLLQSQDSEGMAEGSLSSHPDGLPEDAPQTHRMPEGTRMYSRQPVALKHEEAKLVHHFTEQLGRWLDCTDATRQFTLGVPEKVKQCPVLCHAVLSFAARHSKKAATADAAYQRCIALLIERLNEDTASHDETLLCAIVILRFYEQLSGKSDCNYCCCCCCCCPRTFF
jgi:hypothetical protein